MDTKKLAVVLAIVIVVVAAAAVYVALGDSDSESDENLQIPDDDTMGDLVVFGNANNDLTVDEKDVEYIQKVIDGKAAKTPFCDANHDGIVDEKDIEQVRKMIRHEDGTTVWFIDAMNNHKTVTWPVDRVVAIENSPEVMALSAGLQDKVVGITMPDPFLFQNFKNAKLIAGAHLPDYELIFDLDPDVVIVGNGAKHAGADHMKDPVILKTYADMNIDLISVYSMEGEKSGSCGLTLGYLCGTYDKAMDYYDWCDGMFKEINSKLSDLSESKKHTGLVLFGGGIPGSAAGTDHDYTKALTSAGGKPIADWTGFKTTSDENGTWIFKYNPEYIFKVSKIGYSNLMKDPNAGMAKYGSTADKMAPMEAVKEGRLYIIDSTLPQTLRIAYMAEIMYPDLFGDGFGDKWHEKLLDVYGLDFDVHGQFVISAEDYAKV